MIRGLPVVLFSRRGVPCACEVHAAAGLVMNIREDALGKMRYQRSDAKERRKEKREQGVGGRYTYRTKLKTTTAAAAAAAVDSFMSFMHHRLIIFSNSLYRTAPYLCFLIQTRPLTSTACTEGGGEGMVSRCTGKDEEKVKKVMSKHWMI